ncbi:uncharacterized protein T551_00229 [Pneumocystis jirovecii RU7]|uniref:Branchpoint-bridging protein n=1 Tax=Pneumocystis jirovecii (strain RU7) TaxID=1408657 RepID=A0A0W4ZWJ7_PNEJ7|nr:uncharacterized protein T551_00229 [Pneumocystis jirovecii RU7]KTW32744.1 hypothetical protein T551_00229 [Pneumocystis jirovecii RU7]
MHRESTGTNSVPLGPRRRFGHEEAESEEKQNGGQYMPPLPSDSSAPLPPGVDEPRRYKTGGLRVRKRKNRWGTSGPEGNKALGLIGLPTAITSNMTNEQLEAYALHMRLEEIGQKLRIGDVVPRDGERSPSPPPQYDNFGRRTNTREIRYRKRLEDERHCLIDKAMRTIPDFKPPVDYRRPTKTQDKIYVPVNDYPEINFIGLLIGPRGNTLKKMEAESGAKIAIRGKGSVKEGKGRSDPSANSSLEEDLHCLVMADTEDKVRHAIKLIESIIETAASVPEEQNDLKRQQLRDLAMLNGTLRDDENQVCQNCGNVGHRRFDCPERQNYTANVVCRICGNAGHMSRDCTMRNDPEVLRQLNNGNDASEREYENLMQELGQGRNEVGRIEGASAAPWANLSGSSTAPPWAKALPDAYGGSAPPPWVQSAPSIPPPPGVSQGPPGASSYSVPGTAPPSLSLYGPPPGMSKYGPPGGMYTSMSPGLTTSTSLPPQPPNTSFHSLPQSTRSYGMPPPPPPPIDYNYH